MRLENSSAAAGLSLSPRGAGATSTTTTSANGVTVMTRREFVMAGSRFQQQASGGSGAAPPPPPPPPPPLQPLHHQQQRAMATSPHRFNPKLGAAQDALWALQRQGGAPTVLERNLSFDQEVRLERCRRERSFAAVQDLALGVGGGALAPSAAHYVAYDSQPTRGEITLMKARQANKSRGGEGGGRRGSGGAGGGGVQGQGQGQGQGPVYRRNGLQRPFASIPAAGSQGQGHPSFMLARVQGRHSPLKPDSGAGAVGDDSNPPPPPPLPLSRSSLAQPNVGGEEDGGGGSLPPTRDLGSQPIPEQPEELEERERAVWAPARSRPADDMEGLGEDRGVYRYDDDDDIHIDDDDDGEDVESTDGQRRPLSDTAATEAVYLRNEMTPMSAENKARTLPRDGSLGGGDVDLQRLHTSHRQRAARQQALAATGASGDSAPHAAAASSSGGQPSRQSMTASARRIVVDLATAADKGDSSDSEANDLPSVPPPPPADSFSPKKELPSGRGSPAPSQAEATPPGEPASSATHAQETELALVNSSAPSCGPVASARDPLAGLVQGQGEADQAPTTQTTEGAATEADVRERENEEPKTKTESPCETLAQAQTTDPAPESQAVDLGENENDNLQTNLSTEESEQAVDGQSNASRQGVINDNAQAGSAEDESLRNGTSEKVDEKGIHTEPSDERSEVIARDPTTDAKQAVEAKVEDGTGQEVELGVEAIVTVTMETVNPGDNFDGAKTFLTTTNVESEDWKSAVKV